MHTCISCFDNFRATEVVLMSCKEHHWCKDCILAYFQRALEDVSIFPPRCCNERIKLRDVSTFLPVGIQKVYSDKWTEHNTADKDKIYCANAKCSIFLFPEDICERKATCPKCRVMTCLMCKGKHHSGKCSSSDEMGLKKVIGLAEENGWRKCPNCGHMVEKALGCDHIYVSPRPNISNLGIRG